MKLGGKLELQEGPPCHHGAGPGRSSSQAGAPVTESPLQKLLTIPCPAHRPFSPASMTGAVTDTCCGLSGTALCQGLSPASAPLALGAHPPRLSWLPRAGATIPTPYSRQVRPVRSSGLLKVSSVQGSLGPGAVPMTSTL